MSIGQKARDKPVQPVLRWAGSKKRSLPQIAPYVSQMGGRYIEGFAGSACLFFALRPAKAVIVDNNMDLIRFYRALAQHPLEIYSKFCSLPREPETYYEIRSRWHSGSDEIARAAYFLYLNRNCYNGIFRTNLRGEFNVPFSACRVPPYPSFEEVKTAALELAKVTIRCEDFEEACRAEVRNRDFVYLDPPYYVPSVRIFREYSSKPFNEGDLQRLADLLNEIDRRGARFLLSYPDCRLIRGIARSWRSSRISVRRTISGKLASRGYAPELLIRNY